MNTRRKSTLFLVEQLIVIAVFALCAIACISILTASFFMTRDSNDTANALIHAQNFAEAFKASGGDVYAAVDLLNGADITAIRLTERDIDKDPGGIAASDSDYCITAYFNKEWQQISDETDALYILNLYGNILQHPGGRNYCSGRVTVDQIYGKNLVDFPLTVSAR